MKIVFTDLDGTLLDHDTYSYNSSMPGIELLREKGIPLVLVSSKTYSEMEKLSVKLENKHHFIFENGSGVALFNDGHFDPVILGLSVKKLIDVFTDIKKEFPGETSHILEMDEEEVHQITGLPLERAKLAKARLASLPFLIHGEKQLDYADIIELNKKLDKKDVSITRGGRFYHLIAKSASKGTAISYLLKKYQQEFKISKFLLMGIGDSINDLPMLKEVDFPFLVRKKDQSYIETDFPVFVTENIGPEGFTEAVEIFVNK